MRTSLAAVLALALLTALAACTAEPDPTVTLGPTPPPAPGLTDAPAVTDEADASRTFHVATDGDDDGSGSLEDPFATITAGLMALAPGDTLLIRGGTYEENVMEPEIAAGTPDEPITVAAYEDEEPVIEGLFWLVGPDHWTIDGLEVTWHGGNDPTQHMVKITDGVGWTLRNSEIWGAESYAGLLVAGTQPGQPDDWLVTGNCIHSTRATNERNQDHNVYVNTGLDAGEGVIEGNLFFDAANGQNIKLGGPTSDVTDGSVNVTIRHNTLDHSAQSILIAGASANNTIERNIVGGSFAPWLVRGFQLSGEDNVVRDNIGFEADEWIRNDDGYTGVVDGGGNVIRDVEFDDFGCDAFRPQSPEVQEYGRWAADIGAAPGD